MKTLNAQLDSAINFAQVLALALKTSFYISIGDDQPDTEEIKEYTSSWVGTYPIEEDFKNSAVEIVRKSQADLLVNGTYQKGYFIGQDERQDICTISWFNTVITIYNLRRPYAEIAVWLIFRALTDNIELQRITNHFFSREAFEKAIKEEPVFEIKGRERSRFKRIQTLFADEGIFYEEFYLSRESENPEAEPFMQDLTLVVHKPEDLIYHLFTLELKGIPYKSFSTDSVQFSTGNSLLTLRIQSDFREPEQGFL